MRIFVTGTDTNVGKTIVCSWLCLHTRYPYIKPIQTGTLIDNDSMRVKKMAGVEIYPECYSYKDPVSPHLAAKLARDCISLDHIKLPSCSNLIVEGAGGVMVPINGQYLMVDLIKHLSLPVIVVARTTLGTINHTLLTLQALRIRSINILGVVLNGDEHTPNEEAIRHYGNIPVIARLPTFSTVTREILQKTPLGYQKFL